MTSPDGPDVDLARVECRAMGTDVLVLVRGVERGAARGEVESYVVARLEHLEARWSRFRATSDVSVLNAARGRPVVVAPETFTLVERAIDAWRVTGGAFDPTVLPALLAAGYDRTFDAVMRDQWSTATASDDATPAPGCGGIELDPVVGAIRLPPGVAIDLGGIGKGRAADLLARELLDRGATGVLVDLGGDIRAGGEPPAPSPGVRGWVVGIDDPSGTGATGHLMLADGAVATSSRLRRRWQRDSREMHHLIDPHTGAPATTGLASVTVLAGSAAHAEVVAKAAFVLGARDGAALVERLGVTGVMVHDDGRVDDLAGVAPFRP